MSQLDRIYALLEDADAALLKQVQARVNEQLIGIDPDGQGVSGHGETAIVHQSDTEAAQQRQADQDAKTPEERVHDSPASTIEDEKEKQA